MTHYSFHDEMVFLCFGFCFALFCLLFVCVSFILGERLKEPRVDMRGQEDERDWAGRCETHKESILKVFFKKIIKSNKEIYKQAKARFC